MLNTRTLVVRHIQDDSTLIDRKRNASITVDDLDVLLVARSVVRLLLVGLSMVRTENLDTRTRRWDSSVGRTTISASRIV